MADKPTLHVAVNRPTSIINGNMVPGAVIGSIVGAVTFNPLVGAAAGAAIGGFMQKSQEDKSVARSGKVVEEVKPPTIFNREMAIAGAGAAVVFGGLGAALTGGVGVAGLAAAALSGGLIPLAIGGLGLAAFSVIPVIGGMMGKNRMEREYAEAQVATRQQAAQTQLTQARANAAMNYKNTVPLAEIQAAQSAAPIPGGMAEKIIAARQQQQLAPSVTG
jgi:uncharacterized protein YcfJ